MPSIISLNDFKSQGAFERGSWTIEYSDSTHLSEEVYIKLGGVNVEEISPSGDVLFNFQPVNSKLATKQDGKSIKEVEYLETCLEKAWSTGKAGDQGLSSVISSASRYIIDQLIESLVRLSLLPVNFEIDDPEFGKRKFATIIFDTNALRDGSIRHLREQFPHIQLWTIIPMVSLMEIGERTANIDSKAKGKTDKGKSSLIRVRAQSTIAPQEVKWIKENFPNETLELTPELLRTFRGFEKDADPDRSSINDRLILEGIKDLRRQRSLPEGVYLISGDKGVSRSARLEGIRTLYPARPAPEEFSGSIYSARYSLIAQKFIYCSIHRFLWDLTHVFSKVRIRCESGLEAGRTVELFYYYPTKLVNDWIDDKMEVTDVGSSPATDAV